jgi:hypothetical protein
VYMYVLKVSKSHKQFLEFSILPKTSAKNISWELSGYFLPFFGRFLEELRIPKISLEIYWPLEMSKLISTVISKCLEKVFYLPTYLHFWSLKEKRTDLVPCTSLLVGFGICLTRNIKIPKGAIFRQSKGAFQRAWICNKDLLQVISYSF